MIIVTAIIIIIVIIIIIFFIPSYFSYHHIIISPFAIRHSSFIIHFNILITVVIIILVIIILVIIIVVIIIITVTITIIIITITIVITTILSPFIFHDYIFFRAFCLSPPPFCILWAIPSSSFLSSNPLICFYICRWLVISYPQIYHILVWGLAESSRYLSFHCVSLR